MAETNNSSKAQTDEVTYIIKRKITRSGHKITNVSRSFEVNGETIYHDEISREMFHRSCEHPDFFRLCELFSMGSLDSVNNWSRGCLQIY